MFPKKLKEFDDKDLKLSCSLLEVTLKYAERSDIDVNKLYMKLNIVNELLPSETTNPFDVLKYVKKLVVFLI